MTDTQSLRAVGEANGAVEHREFETHYITDPNMLKADLFQPLNDLDPDKFEGLKDDIRQRGIEDPIWVNKDFAILDGHQRARAWKQLLKEGVDIGEVEVRVFDVNDEEAYRDSVRRNLLRRDMDPDGVDDLIIQHLRHVQSWYSENGFPTRTDTQKRRGIKDWTELGVVSDGNTKVARFLGVPRDRVARVRYNAERSGQLEPAMVFVGGYDNKLKGEIRAGREAAAEAMQAAKSRSSTAAVDERMPYRVTLPDGKGIETNNLEAFQKAILDAFAEDEAANEASIQQIEKGYRERLDAIGDEVREKEIDVIRKEVEDKLTARKDLEEVGGLETLPAWAWEEATENARERRILQAEKLVKKLAIIAGEFGGVDPDEAATALLQKGEREQERDEKELKKVTGWFAEFFGALDAYKKGPRDVQSIGKND